MPVATIETIRCVRTSSGIDAGVFNAFAQLPLAVPAPQLQSVIDTVKALPGVIEAIDAARADPDNLYVTTVTEADRDQAVWPGPGRDVSMQPDQSVAPGFQIEFVTTQNISLFDYDTVSRDDHLGSITIEAAEQGQGEIARLASSSIEGSVYYIIYRVD